MLNIEEVAVFPALVEMPPMSAGEVAEALCAALPTLSPHPNPPYSLLAPHTRLLVHRQEGAYGLVLVWERSVRATGYHKTVVCPCRGRFKEQCPLTEDMAGYQELLAGLQRIVAAGMADRISDCQSAVRVAHIRTPVHPHTRAYPPTHRQTA
jgi:hypothetical protein